MLANVSETRHSSYLDSKRLARLNRLGELAHCLLASASKKHGWYLLSILFTNTFCVQPLHIPGWLCPVTMGSSPAKICHLLDGIHQIANAF